MIPASRYGPERVCCTSVAKCIVGWWRAANHVGTGAGRMSERLQLAGHGRSARFRSVPVYLR